MLTEIKSRRIKFDKPQIPVNKAFEKWFRSSNKKQIFEENPYCEVYKVRDNLYAIFSENADGHTDVWSYLIVGPEKAMLVDNGFGIGNWKALCERLSEGREVICANTHASYDHSYGNAWFDRAYMHKYGVEPCRAQMTAHIWDYLFDENGRNIWLEFDRADLPTENYTYEIIGLEDHHIFDLGGGYEVELIWMPGHMAGHCFYLDRHNRILFTGDGLEVGTSNIAAVTKGIDVHGPEFCNVQAMHRQFGEMMQMHGGDIDYIFPGHGIIDIEASVLKDVMKALDKIMEDPEHPTRRVEKVKKNGRLDVRYYMQVPGFTELVYYPGTVYPRQSK